MVACVQNVLQHNTVCTQRARYVTEIPQYWRIIAEVMGDLLPYLNSKMHVFVFQKKMFGNQQTELRRHQIFYTLF